METSGTWGTGGTGGTEGTGDRGQGTGDREPERTGGGKGIYLRAESGSRN